METGKLKLICFPFAGGNAAYFKKWGEIVGDEIEIKAIEYPGHGMRLREKLCENISQVIDDSFIQIQSILSEEAEYIFWGHSFGATVAFEVARLVQENKLPYLKALVVTGRNSPCFVAVREQQIAKLEKHEFIKWLESNGGLPEFILQNRKVLNMYLPVIRNDIHLLENYTFVKKQTVLDIPILTINGNKDLLIEANSLKKWAEQSSSGFRLEEMAGGHLFFAENIRIFIKEIV